MKATAGVIIERWLYQTLVARPAVSSVVGTKIHRWPAPRDWDYPFVVYHKEQASDFGPISGPVTSATITYRIAAMINGYDTTTIEPVVEDIHSVLDGLDATIAGTGLYVTCERISELPAESDNGPDEEIYTQLGGIYRFMVAQGD